MIKSLHTPCIRPPIRAMTPERMPDPQFFSGTGWTDAGGAATQTYSGNSVLIDRNADSFQDHLRYSDTGAINGGKYLYEYDLIQNSNTVQIYVGGVDQLGGALSGTKKGWFVYNSTGGTNTTGVRNGGSGDATSTFTLISRKPIQAA